MQQHFNINSFQMERFSFENKRLIKNIITVQKNPFGLICVYRLNEIFFFRLAQLNANSLHWLDDYSNNHTHNYFK